MLCILMIKEISKDGYTKMFKVESSKDINFTISNSSSFGYIKYESSSKPDSFISIIKDLELQFDFDSKESKLIDQSVGRVNSKF